MDAQKTCTQCKTEKPATDFYPDKRAKDGLRAACKECAKAQSRQQQKADRTKHNNRMKAWREANPDKWRAIQKRTHAKRKAKKLAGNHKRG
ncbi:MULTISPECIES: hypothetical protein [unclassified Ruegeria]|uniref:hypothetical protein n=1 Tax=unclassified Ruegeria TaxID=2625375 RepID=UPI00148785DE|nr:MULTISPECIES: hypothetical protein [unclassified Ruegeria]NOE32495.1 hypothetical protein [Ruegeria sp. HKCCD7318]